MDAKVDPDPKALACYGPLARFAPTDRRRSGCASSTASVLLIWDNASWHASRAARGWIRDRNRRVKQDGEGVRILAWQMPVKAPWLNPTEPKWVHGKRAVAEPARLLIAAEVEERGCAYFGCLRHEHLIAQAAA